MQQSARKFKTTPAKRAYAQRIRDQRRAERKCRDCEAGLQDGDRSRCVECRERNSAAQVRWRAENGYEVERKRRKQLHAERRELNLCVRCGASSGGKYECEACAHKRKLQEAGVSVLATVGERKPAIRAGLTELRTYQPIDEAEQSFRVRLLRALWWLGWVNTLELFDVCRIEQDGESRERNGAQVMLGRLVKYGLVEKRLVGKQTKLADYRITDAGRAEVARYRAGDLKLRARRSA